MTTSPEILLDNLITAVLVLDQHLVVHYGNPAAEQLMCQSIRRLRHQPLNGHLQHSSVDLLHIRDAISDGQGLTDSDVTWVIDGQQQKVELSASPISWDEQSMMLLEVKLISQQQKISKELTQHVQQQAAKELVRGLAHEIKNPLGGLRGAAQLLEKALPDPSLTEYTQIIIEQADRLRNLVDRLLGPQRPGSREIENIHVVMEKVRQLVELDTGGKISIVRDYDPSLPAFSMDADQLEQAILNIVSNAAEALEWEEQGEITLRTRTAFQSMIHGQHHKLIAQIEIIDNGPGIDPSLQDTLFYPMVTGKANGTGLGLAITRNIIDQHNGRVDVTSWPGQTVFTILLPITIKEEGES